MTARCTAAHTWGPPGWALCATHGAACWCALCSARDPFGPVTVAYADAEGNRAAATSTGGTACKYPGRVGDSALVVCGCYADNRTGAVSATGYGEAIMKVVLAKAVNDLLAAGLPAQEAAEKALALLGERTGGKAGLIVVDAAGHLGASFTTLHVAYGYCTSDSPQPSVRL